MPSSKIVPIDQGDFSQASGWAAGQGTTATPMRSDLIEKASKVIPDTPLLINVVSQRVRQLNQGRAPLVNTGGARVGLADVALMEIIEGKVAPIEEEDEAKP